MLIIIHNLPSPTRYVDVKNLIQTHCNLPNVILDNLMSEGAYKKVTVGVADDADAHAILRKLDGFILAGNKLKVEELRSKKGSQQKQQGRSDSSKISRWTPKIPSLMESNTSGLNSLLGQNSSSMAKNMSMRGQHSSMMGQNSSMLGQNSSMMGQNSPMMGQNSSMTGQNSSMMGQNSSIMGQNSSMTGQNSSIMGQNSSILGQNSSIMGQNSSIMGHNSSIMGQNSSMMGQNSSMMGQNSSSMMGQNTPVFGQNMSIMGQNTPMMGYNASMMGLNNSMMMGQNATMMNLDNSLMGQNNAMIRQNNMRRDPNSSSRGQNTSITDQNSSGMGHNSSSMGQFSPFMGQMNPLMGQNAPMMGSNQPVMVPPPLMNNYTPYSAPFYMTPQSNIYGNHSSGQQMAGQLSDFNSQKDNMQSQNIAFPDTGNRKNVPNNPVWGSSDDKSKKRYSGNSERERERERGRERERYDRTPTSSSRRPKWDTLQEDYESTGMRNKSQPASKRVVQPWANEGATPYNRNAEYGLFDRSNDHEQDLYSRRQDHTRGSSGPNLYQKRFSSGGGPEPGSNYRDNSPAGYRRGPPRDGWRGRERFSPPSKRFKVNQDEPNYKYGQSQHKDNSASKKLNMSMRKIIERDSVWRSQAAAAVVKEMFTTIKTDNSVQQNVAYNLMKIAVRNRMLINMNNMMMVKITDQMVLYRRKFKPDEDQLLYDRVVRHIKNENEREKKKAESQGTAQEADKQPDTAEVNPAPKPAVKPPPSGKTVTKPSIVIPKHPYGNKELYKIQKKVFKDEFRYSGPSSELDDATKKAVETEINCINEIIKAEFTNPQDDAEKMISEKIKNDPTAIEETTKMLTLNLAKRILQVDTVPLVRVLGIPKPPRKPVLVEFLKDKGVISLKKSERKPIYILTCQSYEAFDKLCALHDVVLDNIKVKFKPMYLTAPLEKVKYKKGQRFANVMQTNEPEHIFESGCENVSENAENNTTADENIATETIKEEIVSPIKNKVTETQPKESKQYVDEVHDKVDKVTKQEIIEEDFTKDDFTGMLYKDQVSHEGENDETILDQGGTSVTKQSAGEGTTEQGSDNAATEQDVDDGAYDDYDEEDANDGNFEVNEDDLEDY